MENMVQEQPTKETIAHLFHLIINVEKRARAFYRGLERKFQHVARASTVWQAMAEDEDDHIDQLEAIYARLSPAQRRAEVDPSVLWKAKEAQAFSPADSLDGVETLDDAFQIAHALEHSEVNALFEFIMDEFVEPETQRDFLVSQLRDHVARLEALKGLEWQRDVRIKEA